MASTSDIISWFTPASTDQAVKIINGILGVGWQNLYRGTSPSSGSVETLAAMFQVFNSVVLTGLCFYLVYAFSLQVVGTTTEGTPLGRTQHTVFVPSRAAISFALLAPAPFLKGFCLIQGFVMLAMAASIGLAGTLWGSAIDQLAKNPGTMAAPLQESVRPMAMHMLKSEVTRDYLVYQQGYDIQGPTWQKIDGNTYAENQAAANNCPPGAPACQAIRADARNLAATKGNVMWQLKYAPADGLGLPAHALGGITVQCSVDTTSSCDAQRSAVNSMYNKIAKAAVLITASGQSVGELSGTNAISEGISDYRKRISQYATSRINNSDGIINARIDQLVNNSKADGFLMAGAWYWRRANLQNRIRDSISAQPSFDAPDAELIAAVSDSGLGGYLEAAQDYTRSRALNDPDSATIGSSGGTFSKVVQFFSTPFRGFLRKYADNVGSSNTLTSTATIGHYILNANAIAMVTYAGYISTTEKTAGIIKSLPVVGNAVASGLELLSGSTILKKLGVIIWFLLVSLFVTGMTLAYYLPAVPFILFTLAAVGTFITFFAALVAAPLVALSIAFTDGEGWLGTSARQGIMLLLNVLLRPPLMIFGLYLSFLLINALDSFIADSFVLFFNSMNGGSYFIYGLLAGIILLTVLLTLMFHMVFGMTNELAEQVPAYIGQQAQKLYESRGSNAAGTALAAGAGAAGGGAVMGGANSMARGLRSDAGNKEQDQNKRDERANRLSGGESSAQIGVNESSESGGSSGMTERGESSMPDNPTTSSSSAGHDASITNSPEAQQAGENTAPDISEAKTSENISEEQATNSMQEGAPNFDDSGYWQSIEDDIGMNDSLSDDDMPERD